MITDLEPHRHEQKDERGSSDVSSSDRLQLVPLSTQKEGDSWLVGSVELNCFFQMPDIAVQIIRLLQQGLLLSEVKAHLQAAGDGDFDLDDFAATLIEIGLAYRGDSPARTAPPVAPSARWLASAAKVGQVIFSWPGACLYLLVIGYAALCAVRAPRILPPLHVFYFPGHLTASLLLLLVFYFVMVMLHEMGHMLAAARVGIDSHLGVGTRLWTIVMEADLTGVLSLPRRQRYLPLLAGLVVDVLNVSILLIAVSHLMAVHASPFLIQLLQALTMQILLSMSWQGNVFLRTDLYYVLCNALAYPDLDRDARLYFRSLLFMVSGGRLGVDLPEGQRPWRIAILRLFSIVWFVGRVGSLYLLFAAAGPTLLRYAVDDYHALTTASAAALPWDYIIFTVLSASMLAAGIWMWLAQMKSRKLTLAGQQ